MLLSTLRYLLKSLALFAYSTCFTNRQNTPSHIYTLTAIYVLYIQYIYSHTRSLTQTYIHNKYTIHAHKHNTHIHARTHIDTLALTHIHLLIYAPAHSSAHVQAHKVSHTYACTCSCQTFI